MENAENNFLPLTAPAMRVVKANERRSFWSKHARDIDRIGWTGKYHLSDSEDEDSDEDSESEEDGEEPASEEDSDGDNDEDNTNQIDTPVNNGEPSSNGLQTNCYCHDILKHRLQDYDPDLKQQVLMEVYNWLEGGYHSCSSGFIDTNTNTDIDIDSHGRNGFELTEQEREEYRAISTNSYWTEVYWAGNTQLSDTEDVVNHSDDWEEISDAEEWEDVYGARLSVEPSFAERYMAILLLVFGYWVMVFIRSRG
jgi:endogenous inhibitor of DNA gyrase (YacG/DUF329 family)